jgi:prenyltransferase beta subunit
MTVNGEMLSIARRAMTRRGRLPDERPRVERFVGSRLCDDGGFADRSGKSDLYYTVFGVQAALAIGMALPAERIRRYLEAFEPPELDLVHLGCLVRCWSCLPAAEPPAPRRDEALGRLASFQAADGGYALEPGRAAGSAYGGFLALGAYQDLGRELADADALARCVQSLRTPDGAYANDRHLPVGSVPATAAAVVTLRQIGQDPPPGAADWLLAQHDPAGGFRTVPVAPEPDLLATATGLHALAALGVDPSPVRPACRRFVRSLYGDGGFRGQAGDETPDCEYTFYGLLALGHLAG